MRKTRGSGDYEVDMLAAAFLAGQGRKQIEIAERLGISQADVSRLLAKARGGFLRSETRFLDENVSPGVMEKVRQRVGRRDLEKKLSRVSPRPGLPEVRVFGCGSPSGDPQARMDELGRRAAAYVRDLILRSRLCGVTWGGTLRSLMLGLRSVPIATPAEEIKCVPLTGEPLGEEPASFSSSTLAHELGELVNGRSYNGPSLSMVPAFLPANFTKAELNAVWKLMELAKSYGEIFGPRNSSYSEKALAGRLDMILTSIGPAERPLGFGQGRLFQGSVTEKELSELVIGDIGGVCIPQPGLGKREMTRLHGVTDRWTGLREEHIRSCVERAARNGDAFSGPPGVVVMTGGRSRAQFVFEIVKRGLVNHLVIDDDLEKELDQIFGS